MSNSQSLISKSVVQGKVSVIITAYNSEEPLRDALRSVVDQDYGNIEIIVVDDGSRADRRQFIQGVALEFEGVRLVQQENAGLPAARNAGIEHSSGEYLAFLDHDDLWNPALVRKLVAEFRGHGELGVAFCRAEHMTEDGRLTGRVSNPKLRGLGVEDFLVSDPMCCGSSFLIKRTAFESVGGFDPEFVRAETPEIAIRLLVKGWKIQGVRDVLVSYRNSPGGLTSGKLLKKYRLRLLDKAFRLCPELKGRLKYALLIRLNQIRIKLRRLLIA